jgi:tetratricopeptide (TPR) repeat protein
MNHIRNNTPSKADLLFQKAFMAHNAGQLMEAEALYIKVLREAPSNMDTLYLLGTLYSQQGKVLDAAKYLTKALKINPNHPEALNNMGLTLMAQRKREEAAIYYRRALKQRPDYADACSNLGYTLEVLGELDEAEELLRKALQLNPHLANAYYNLGLVLLRKDHFAEAAQCFRRGLELKPDLAVAYNDLGNIYKIWGRLDEAMACFIKSIALNPHHFFPRNNLGATYEELGRYEEALIEYEHAITLAPDDTRARWNTAYLYLRQGILDKGWEAHENRLAHDDNSNRFPYPLWDGTLLKDKTVLIMAEQGVGDEIFFASCFPDIVAQAKHVVIECDVRLAPLFARSFPTATVKGASRSQIGWIVDVPKVDVRICAGSIPRYMRPTLESFPKTPAYLVADQYRTAFWRSRLALLGQGLKIGICWRSGLRTGERHKQYSTLLQWKHIFNIAGVHFVNLQYDECSDELREAEQAFGVHIENFSELNMKNELDETCALISSLDLVISAGTAVSEMAGALGVEVFRLDVFVKSMDTLGTSGSPWHPSMRLFPQSTVGDWDTPLALVANAIEERAAGGSRTIEYVALQTGEKVAVIGSLEDLPTYVLKEQKGWFDQEYGFVLQFAQAGMRMVDVGAGVGQYSIPLARRVAGGNIWAITHTATETNLLMQSVKHNNLQKTLRIAIAEQNWTLDAEMDRQGLENIDFIRVADNACSLSLLEGAAHFFSMNSPLVMFAIKPGDAFPMPVVQWLIGRGYSLYRLVPGMKLLVPLTSLNDLDAFSGNLFACQPDRAQQLEQRGLLVRQVPDLANLPGIEQVFWKKHLGDRPYVATLCETWANSQQREAGWEIYWMALNLYALAKSQAGNAGERYAQMLMACNVLTALVKEQANLPRLFSLCRILTDLGKREVAVHLLNQMCELLHSGMQSNVHEPFLALTPEHETAQPGERMLQWLITTILEQRENLRAFSSYFTGQESIVALEEIIASGFAAENTQRKLVLVKARFNKP